MTGETAQDCRLRIENPVTHTAGPDMAGCATIAIELRVPALLVLQIVFPIHAAHERDGLPARAERPFARLSRLGAGERPGVACCRLRAVLSGMAVLAGRRPG